PEKITDTLVTFFRERGYSVAVNRPFAGALVPLRFYRKDPRVMSVMIEINRRLYIDRNIRKKPGFTTVKQDIAAAIRKMNP
ncbi:MAG: N-formylglutamate amidohydrolase, partial [Lachnospiraceae bacterium]|nr:N-formylglutamate amidohydrolase [Lachnospiraceae bacterium]